MTDQIQRSALPIPDRPHVGLITCDAKDRERSYPPIQDNQAREFQRRTHAASRSPRR